MPRVLSLLPSTTEIIYLLECEESLVGVTHECDFPPATACKPSVTSARINPSMSSESIDAMVREQLDSTGTLYSIDMDLVRRLRPEIVLTQQLCTVCAVGFKTVEAAMMTLEEPPQVVNIEPGSLGDVIDSIVEIGGLLGVEDRAAEKAEGLRSRLQAIPRRASSPRVLFLEWLVPPFSAGHWVPELVEAAGGVPVLGNPGDYSRGIEWEEIYRTDFDMLVISCCGFSVERGQKDLDGSEELAALVKKRPGLSVILFDGNHYFIRPGPRLVESAELLHEALAGRHPGERGPTVSEPYRLMGWDAIVRG